MSPGWHRVPAAATLALVALAGCGLAGPPPDEATPSPFPAPTERSPVPSPEPFDPEAVRLRLDVVASGLSAPLLVTVDGRSERLYVVEQGGRIRVVRNGRVRGEPFLDVTDRVGADALERGLLGLAFHPDYPDDPRLFVNYTDRSGDTVIAEYRADRRTADRSSERVLLRVDQPFANHNGGAVLFGPDGYLYLTLGDGGSAGDPDGNGQRPDTLLGTILRIDVDRQQGDRGYGIPEDNPFAGGGAGRPEVWAYGLRNPWRISFDREDGDLWIGDVGQNRWEEIDREPAERGGGVNYGWNVVEGRACFHPPQGCDVEGLEKPVAVYPTSEGCAVIGGHVYRGEQYPALRGGYLFADYCAGTIWALDAAEPRRGHPVVILESGRRISSFGEDGRGELYVTDLAAGDVLRVVAASD